MNTADVDDQLHAFRECVRYIAERGPHSDEQKKKLAGLADALEAAMDGEVRDDVKVLIPDLGSLILQAVALPPEPTIDDLDWRLFVSVLRGSVLLQ
jgi:hypothetical protein